MGEKIDLQEEEAEEALSLCDLAITTGDDNISGDPSNHIRRSASEPPEFFEFFNDLNSDMCSAEDVIFCGKLIPFKEQSISQKQPPKTTSFKPMASHRRSESLSHLQSSAVRSNSGKMKVMRNSRSLDCRKLHRSSNSMISPAPEIERNLSAGGGSNKRVLKPRWYLLMFGMVKFPTEMMLGEIKTRQFKRSPSTIFPPPANIPTGENLPVTRKENKGSWKLLKVLSCKDHASITVTASFKRIPEL